MTRIWFWLGAWSILTVGCRFIVSLDGLSDPAATSGDGGAGGGDGGANGTSGTAGTSGTGGAGAGASGGRPDDASPGDGKPADARPDNAQPSGAIVIYTAPPDAKIRGIAQFGSNIYWVESETGRGVFRMSKQGDASGPLQIRRTPTASDVAVDSKSIYWSDGPLILEMPITGGVNTLIDNNGYLSHNSTLARYIAVDDQATVYVSTAEGNIISGAPGTSGVPFQTQPGVAGIAFYAIADAGVHDLLWGYNAGIKEGPTKGGGSGVDLYTGSTEPVHGLATDGTNMYWVSNGQAIKKGDPSMAAQGDPRCFTPPQDLGPYADLAVDEQWIYFTWPNKNQILKCLKH